MTNATKISQWCFTSVYATYGAQNADNARTLGFDDELHEYQAKNDFIIVRRFATIYLLQSTYLADK